MTFRFDIEKAIAATAYLLRKRADGQYNILPLVKTLYYANRKSLVCFGRSITGDSLCSMENGPVVSDTYNLMKDDKAANPEHLKRWHEFISPRNEHALTLKKIPSFGILSGREKSLLDEAYNVVSNVSGTWKHWSHKEFPEWEEVGKSSKGIDPKTILKIEHVDPNEILQIEEELAELNWLQPA